MRETERKRGKGGKGGKEGGKGRDRQTDREELS